MTETRRERRVLDKLRKLNGDLKGLNVACTNKYTQNRVPYVFIHAGFRVVFFGAEGVYRVYVENDHATGRVLKLKGSPYTVAREIADFVWHQTARQHGCALDPRTKERTVVDYRRGYKLSQASWDYAPAGSPGPLRCVDRINRALDELEL